MIDIKDTFGKNRVIEPKGAVPVTAWKLDNSREIGPNECRVNLKYIHIERDSLQQIYGECGYDEEKVKVKIIDLINRRGKLHNPFTDSGGQCFGVIEEMGSEYEKNSDYSVGEEVLTIVSMTAHPIHINSIRSIDYNYGQIVVSGYGIIFSDSPITTVPEDINTRYTLVAHDEVGSFFSVYNIAKQYKRFLIIGQDILSCLMYVGAIKQGVDGECYISVIMDEDSIGDLDVDRVIEEFNKSVDSTYIIDFTDPVSEVKDKLTHETFYDLTVNCEDMPSAGILGALLTRSGGEIHSKAMNNSNTQSILFAESVSKEIVIQEVAHYHNDYGEFTSDLLRKIQKDLDRMDSLFTSGQATKKSRAKKASIISNTTLEKSGDFIFASSITESMLIEAINVAKYDCNVIIQGETGVGKEKVLDLIYRNSERKGKPCIKINCATIQENLAESEFFGYEPGAFTGAQSSGKDGYFEKANGGILFLDEVGTLSLNLQSKLLRVLQENQYYRVGGDTPYDIDVRVICANNVSLKQMVEDGKFREDLYYRLNICTITVPPLRERKEDIAQLGNTFLRNYIDRYGEEKRLAPSAVTRLTGHDWPGNVRELENLIHRLFINTEDYIITESDVDSALNEGLYEDLVINLQRKMHSTGAVDFNRIIEQQEKQLIEYALKKQRSTRKAADFLNMTQPQLMRKKKKYDL